MSAFDDLMAANGRLIAGAEALAALATRLRADAEGIALDPALERALDAAVAQLGLDLQALDQREKGIAAMYARAFLRQALDMVEDPGRAPGWDYEDEAMLLSLGRASAVIASVFAQVAPELDGLQDALAREGATFCDVGSGVGALSVALCRTWPNLTVVGLEPWAPSRSLSAREVAHANLEDRIEIRPLGVEELREEAAFDAAFLAGPFLPERVIPAAIERVHAALKPGGWLLFGAFAGPPEPLAQRLIELRVVRSGGTPIAHADVVERLNGAGYLDAHHVPRRWQAPLELVAARRAR